MKEVLLDSFYQWLANRVLPKRLIYWVFIKGAAIATSQEYSNTHPAELDVMTAMQRLDTQNKAFKKTKERSL